MKKSCCVLLALAALLGCAFPAAVSTAQERQDSMTGLLQRPAPDFTLADTRGTPHSLSEYRHRPVVLVFLCGCQRCAQFAHLWGQMQRSNAVAPTDTKATKETKETKEARPLTVIVYAGDAGGVQSLAQQAGLDRQQTVLLPDLQMGVSLDLYKSMPCPRTLVIDSAGVVRHIDGMTDKAPDQGSVAGIAMRTLQGLQNLTVRVTKVVVPSQKRATPPAKAHVRPIARQASKSKRQNRSLQQTVRLPLA